jgi:dTDP-glucose 4,6-dehydratase
MSQLAPWLTGDCSVDVLEGDVRNLKITGHAAFTHVIHAATCSVPCAADATTCAIVSTIVDGTRRLLELAAGWRVRAFLFTSSGAVYGRQPSDLSHVDEDYLGAPDPLEPRNAYGEAKRLAELLCASEVRDGRVAAKIARCFTFVGPLLPLNAHFAIGNFIRDGMAGRTIVVNGDGTARRSYMYVGDLVGWLIAALVRGEAGRAYNIGSEREVSIGELARHVGTYFGVPIETRGAASAGMAPERYVPSNRRARDELGVQERVPLERAVARTAKWHTEPDAAPTGG